MTALLPLFLSASLTACGLFSRPEPAPPTVLTKIQVAQVSQPNLTCPQRPEPPDLETATQRDVALYLHTLNDFAEDVLLLAQEGIQCRYDGLRGTQ
jgi:hypothetical protein